MIKSWEDRRHTLHPKNGQWFVGLLAGGPSDIARELREYLSETRGILLKHHWEWNRNRQFDRPIPEEVDLVLILKDMIGHPEEQAARLAAKRSGAVPIRVVRKKSSLSSALSYYGITKTDPVPLAIRTSSYFSEDLGLLAKPESDLSIVQEEIVSEPRVVSLEPVVKTVRRVGIPRPEIASLAAELQAMVAEDGVAVMITPTELSISAWEKK